MVLTTAEYAEVVAALKECKAANAACRRLGSKVESIADEHPAKVREDKADLAVYRLCERLWEPLFENMTHDWDLDVCVGFLEVLKKRSKPEAA
jgi:hypothetical protein